jgi:hypothetical protein
MAVSQRELTKTNIRILIYALRQTSRTLLKILERRFGSGQQSVFVGVHLPMQDHRQHSPGLQRFDLQ